VPISKRHHYTPRYYLKRFENDKGAMWRFDIDSRISTRGNNAHFGYEKHWNTLENPPEAYEPDWAERRLSEADGPASKIVTQILAGDFPKDIHALACAISFMQNNQPRLKRYLKENNVEDVGDYSDDHWLLSRVSASLDDWRNYVPNHYSLQAIDENDKVSRFLTSSNPLIEMENQPTKLLPLSNRHCLFMSFDPQFIGYDPRAETCDSSIVAGINQLTIKNSWQYIYSSTPNFDP
jgi:hypothetical protein